MTKTELASLYGFWILCEKHLNVCSNMNSWLLKKKSSQINEKEPGTITILACQVALSAFEC